MPPSIVHTVPVTQSLVIKGMVASAIDSTLPRLSTGKCGSHMLTTFGSAKAVAVRSTGTTPGAMAFTRTLSGAYSSAKPRVRLSNAALLAA
eukprot:CAMPEP_0202498710 /NCGR_PEP_ID=MMETSP1361-20130828/27221_1 /ASSEMBLY_ACC=CAM_ASM_000849 /TAXON_ID=210615 /ORGANISM="Staurosira complex sp., Strain CCMP2646" /LENGTH=90 /DNA_ID=CAMNT_0049130705 /DNA_START=52 /DNA_END=320 /DNA_ORIENTATION=+